MSDEQNTPAINVSNSTNVEIKDNTFTYNLQNDPNDKSNLKKLKLLAKIIVVLLPLILTPLVGHGFDLIFQEQKNPPTIIDQDCITAGDGSIISGNNCTLIINPP